MISMINNDKDVSSFLRRIRKTSSQISAEMCVFFFRLFLSFLVSVADSKNGACDDKFDAQNFTEFTCGVRFHASSCQQRC